MYSDNNSKAIKELEYAERLLASQNKWWKRLLNLQWPYRLFLRTLHLGLTLDVGCGVGRNLKNLGSNTVGVDIDEAAVRIARNRGFVAYTVPDFEKSKWAREGSFDSLLFAHVLEHMRKDEARETIRFYLKYLRKQGRIVMIVPQERGFKADSTHKVFLDFTDLCEILEFVGIKAIHKCSFPFPRFTGKIFKYNESIVIGYNKS